MSDVRLTALNPDDSSPVPVACDAAGKLLLQDPPTFDGNLDGNLNVTGDASISGDVSTPKYKVTSGNTNLGQLFNDNSSSRLQLGDGTTTKIDLHGSTGSAEFQGNIFSNRFPDIFSMLSANVGGVQYGYAITDSISNLKTGLAGDGGATFAGGNAGFTSDGYLYCKTQSGQTVMMTSVTNGTATWASYSPPTIRDRIKEKLDDAGPSTKPNISDIEGSP
jgi:hypothetical protein|tara:strand:+ start:1380 stop:2039 length:660 start_codon:yes stop_codon:yes gene_type:complete